VEPFLFPVATKFLSGLATRSVWRNQFLHRLKESVMHLSITRSGREADPQIFPYLGLNLAKPEISAKQHPVNSNPENDSNEILARNPVKAWIEAVF
jgi:hypothetical protein